MASSGLRKRSMNFITDTSAALSLSFSHYFKAIFEEYQLIITPAVESELGQFANYSDELGLHARGLLKLKLQKKMPKSLLALKLDQGEVEVFSLAMEQNCFALTDDAHAARVGKEKYPHLRIKPSFYLLMLYYQQQKMMKEQMIADLNGILVNRNWLNGALWDYVKELVGKE